jgi:hypothetical protein
LIISALVDPLYSGVRKIIFLARDTKPENSLTFYGIPFFIFQKLTLLINKIFIEERQLSQIRNIHLKV